MTKGEFFKKIDMAMYYKQNIPDDLDSEHATWLIEMVDHVSLFNVKKYDKENRYRLQNIQAFFTYLMALVLFVACLVVINIKGMSDMHEAMKGILFAYVGLVFNSFGVNSFKNIRQTLNPPKSPSQVSTPDKQSI